MIQCLVCDNHKGHDINVVRDVDLSPLNGVYCDKHAEIVEEKLKEMRLVEVYNGQNIYHIVDEYNNHRFYPEWGNAVHYSKIQWARNFLDRKKEKTIN